MRMRRVHLTMRTEGIITFSNRYGVVVWTGEDDTKTISVDANIFENGAKQLRFRLKTELFCFGYSYCPHYNAGNDHRKRSHSKTLSGVERFENDAF